MRPRGKEASGNKGHEYMVGTSWPQTHSAPAWRWWDMSQLWPGSGHWVLHDLTCPTGRHSVLVQAWCCADPGISQLWSTICSLALWLSQPAWGPIVPWSSHNRARSRVPMSPASPQPQTFYSLLLQFLVLFHLRESSTTYRSVSGVLQCPSAEDPSPTAGQCTQQTRLCLPMSHARRWLLLCTPDWFSALLFCLFTDLICM